MAATEGRRTLFKGEMICAIFSMIGFVLLILISLVLHIKFTHWCSFTSSIFVYLINLFLFSFSCTIFSFYSWLIHIVIMFATLMFFFFFITTFLFALAGKVEGWRLDEPKLMFMTICPMWSALLGITIWLSLGNHATLAHILIGFFIIVILSLCIS